MVGVGFGFGLDVGLDVGLDGGLNADPDADNELGFVVDPPVDCFFTTKVTTVAGISRRYCPVDCVFFT